MAGQSIGIRIAHSVSNTTNHVSNRNCLRFRSPSTEHFSLAIAGALDLKGIIDYFQLQSFVKTSGGKGLQLYIPLPANRFTYEEVRVFTEFVCRFLCQQKPHLYTIERLKRIAIINYI